MRLRPLILDFALLIGAWTWVLTVLRRQRARMAGDASPREARSQRLQSAAAISAMVGVTCFVAWLIGDTAELHWLRVLSLPATVGLIAAAAVLSGYGAWIKHR
jgi:hypothetical protein